MKFLLAVFLVTVAINALPKQYYNQETCGYAACPEADPNRLNVHIVPHSHDDVGWLKTVDQYYYGTRSNIQHAGVQFILDSVVKALLLNPERRFIQVETAFFWQWWQEQSDDVKESVKYLVNNGQLEIIGGAWSMNDEAASHYQSTIDQFTWGFRRLDETLGKCAKPKIGWQIDPFGHSREQASLFAQMGFDGLFFARLDYRDKEQRLQTKSAEMLWQGSQSLGLSSEIFTHVLFNHYMTPPGFCFDVMCPDTPIVDNEKSPEYNAIRRAGVFLNFVKNQAQYYKTNNVIITMGGDFHYQDALSYFTNMDRLMKAMRKVNPNVNVFYSTPSCYLKAVNEAQQVFPIKTDDFFPYASDPHAYWTGYFTSRPTSKRMERLANNFLQVTKQLSSAAFVNSFDETVNLNYLREAMGVMQHHDAITGTEKQHVANDYHRILYDALQHSAFLASNSLKKITDEKYINFHSCLMLNISQCDVTETNPKFLLSVYNPLSRPVTHYVRVPVPNTNYKVTNAAGKTVETQFVPIFNMISKMPGRKSSATHELVFRADNIPGLGQKVFYVEHIPGYKNYYSHLFRNTNNIKVNLNDRHQIKSIIMENTNLEINPNFFYYNAEVGNNMNFKNRSSGAYIFRPHEKHAIPVANLGTGITIAGPHVFEYFELYNDWIGRVTRIYEKKDYVEINWIVGPIPPSGLYGKEVITKYTTNINNNKIFYTDSNGREMIKRKKDFRVDYNLTNEEPVSSNYYPVTSKITIEDEENNLQFSVLNDRAQGGSSLQEGEVELMVHRRLLHDDAFGVEEALNEQAYGIGLIATGKHYLTANAKQNPHGYSASARERIIGSEIHMAPWLFISPLSQQFNKNEPDISHLEFSLLRKPLPENVQILTLEPWTNGTLLLRVEHILEIHEDPILSTAVSINFEDLFSIFKVKKIVEMSLGGNQLASNVERLKWQREYKYNRKYYQRYNEIDEFTVIIKPMEIRTFLMTVELVTYF